ncbi:MAG: Sapep family Mn(2+)-dependent dipeptidase [Acidobacteriota bacterium]
MWLSLFLAASLASRVTAVQQKYDRLDAQRLVPMLTEVLRFQTVQGDDEARRAQTQWLKKTARELGLEFRDAGLMAEVELPGPPGAPVLGLMVHGDVVPVDATAWSFPPFTAQVKDGFISGRGAADDKGPMVQALLAMHALRASGIARTHTVRLLVGSDEESDNKDVKTYLETHKPPNYTLVLDSNFPVVVGEKAWNSLTVTADVNPRADDRPYVVTGLSAGLATSIVPDRASVTLRWKGGDPDWGPLQDEFFDAKLPAGTRLEAGAQKDVMQVVVYGKSAHAGVNLEGGRNALIALAKVMEGKLPAGGADDLLAFARMAGQDLYGTGLGITDHDPLWGRYAVNVATIKRDADDPNKATLTINVRRIPPRTGAQLKEHLEKVVADFNRRSGASLVAGGFYDDEPLAFDPRGKLVRRLLADYGAATGVKNPKPAISGGGTYAKRLPNAIAFGMWFPDKPYPGHDVDEKNPIADMQKGTGVLIRALVDIATGPPIVEPFKP